MRFISPSEWWKWFDDKSDTWIPEKKVQYDNSNIFFVQDVEIVSGIQINSELHHEMQIIHTDKSDFIDYSPEFGGCNWKLYIGKYIIAEINKRYGYYWLLFIRVKESPPTELQEEIPKD